MPWYSTKAPATDPDNPLADEQVRYVEWNDMALELRNKIVNKTVDTSAIGNDKLLVYKAATSTFVFETQSVVSVLNELTDVVISGVPADNELFAYNTATSKWINQTAAEAGVATVAGLADYLALSGGTMAGNLDMDDHDIMNADAVYATDVDGVRVIDSVLSIGCRLATTNYALQAHKLVNMNTWRMINLGNPVDAQDGVTKSYNDARLFTKEAVTNFTDGYVPVYRTGSGKFEMEDGIGAGVYLPLAGGTMAGNMSMGGNNIIGLSYLKSDGLAGIPIEKYPSGVSIVLCNAGFSFTAWEDASMNSNNIKYMLDPVDAQDASTRHYDDLHLFTKEAVTDFTNGYIPVYRTASGKFEMEDGAGSAGLPVTDTTAIVKGSADGTKQVRFEADSLTPGVTRVLTVPDRDMTLCGTDDALMRSGGTMSGNLITGSGVGEPTIRAISNYGVTIEDYLGNAMLEVGFYGGVVCNAWEYHNYGIDMSYHNIHGIKALIFYDAIELTIASGAVVASGSYHRIDTQGDASTDNLDNITGGVAGQHLTIRAENSARMVVVRDSVGNIALSANMTLDNVQDTLSLIYDGANWLETGRSDNGA